MQKWLAEKVPRRVILYAPVAILDQRRAGHRCRIGTLQSSIARDPIGEFRWNLHNFEWFLMAEPPITARGFSEFVLKKFRGFKVSMATPIFDMDPEIEVLLRIEMSRDPEMLLIFRRIELRTGCTKSHAISSTETWERAISSFRGAPCGVSSRMLTCIGFSASLPRGNRGWRLTAGAKFKRFVIGPYATKLHENLSHRR